jgi:hypothetical protein
MKRQTTVHTFRTVAIGTMFRAAAKLKSLMSTPDENFQHELFAFAFNAAAPSMSANRACQQRC